MIISTFQGNLNACDKPNKVAVPYAGPDHSGNSY